MLGIIIVMSTIVTAQQEITSKKWTNGDCEYHVLEEDNVLLFHGIDRHEGGFGFALHKQANGNMVVSKIQNDTMSYYCNPEYLNGTIEYKVLNKQELLLVRNDNGVLADIFINDNLDNMLTSSVVRYLAGSYSDAEGKTYAFSPDTPLASGFGNIEYYTVIALYYLQGFLISFGDNKPYMITGDTQTDVNGLRLRIYPCIENHGEWEPQKTWLELKKNRWGSNVNESIHGRYPYTSVRVMTRGELQLFTLNELDIMRKEIFARYGHIFKTDRYNDHFNAQPWYKGTVEDASGLISEIERLNIEQIIAVQQRIRTAN